MNVLIVFDSNTGTTKACAIEMGEIVRSQGHECLVVPLEGADEARIEAADALCVGCWTKGLFVIAQKPTEAVVEFIGQLGPLDGKPVAVFTTYKLAVGGMLRQMKRLAAERGASVTGMFKSKGPFAAKGFAGWVAKLETLQPH